MGGVRVKTAAAHLLVAAGIVLVVAGVFLLGGLAVALVFAGAFLIGYGLLVVDVPVRPGPAVVSPGPGDTARVGR